MIFYANKKAPARIIHGVRELGRCQILYISIKVMPDSSDFGSILRLTTRWILLPTEE
jgi:hypothetical protein